jgi:hypothetical protein
MGSPLPLFGLRNSGRKTAAHFSWNCFQASRRKWMPISENAVRKQKGMSNAKSGFGHSVGVTAGPIFGDTL